MKKVAIVLSIIIIIVFIPFTSYSNDSIVCKVNNK